MTGNGKSKLDKVLIGTSSFSEPDWVGPFYPKGMKSNDFIGHFATRFRTVEVDATYYAIPGQRTIDNWIKKTPADFIISSKFPRSIVHCGEGPLPDSKKILQPDATYKDRDRFLETMALLKGRLGPIVLQFPYFNRKVFSGAGPFTQRLNEFLSDLPADFRYAVEIRNRHWLTKEFAELLRSHNAALVLVDQAWMPHGDEVAEMFDPITADFVYIRLLGDRKEIEAITDKWNSEVINRDLQIRRWAEFIIGLLERNLEIFVYANNHYSGYAPATSDKLSALLKEQLGE